MSPSCLVFQYLIGEQMELINECSIRFAEDKDFKLLVRI